MLALQFSTFSSLSVFLLLLSQTTPSIAVPSTYDPSISARDAEPIDQTLAIRDFAEGLAARDFEERDIYERDFEERNFEERDFEERDALKMPPSRGSKLDFAGHVIDGAGNIIPAIINAATGHKAKRGLYERDFEERDFDERDFEERDYEERDVYERDFEERDAEAATRGSRLNFASPVDFIATDHFPAMGNPAAGYEQRRDIEVRDFKERAAVLSSKLGPIGMVNEPGVNTGSPPHPPFPSFIHKKRRTLEDRNFGQTASKVALSDNRNDRLNQATAFRRRDLEARAVARMPHSRGSKLDFAGNAIGAVGNIVGGLGR